MKRKMKFDSPRVLQEKHLLLEPELMAGSIVESIESIRSTGQETIDLNFSESTFNHNWQED